MAIEKLVWWAVGAVPAFALMEPWSRFVHGRVWHGALWGMHRSHHEPRLGRFELNDVFVFAHALAVGPLFALAAFAPATWWREVLFGVAVGVSLFGVSYAVLHDGLAHGRLPVGWLGRVSWLRRIVGAHRAHHATGGAPYGFFLGPRELRRALAERRRVSGAPGGR